MLVIYFNCMSHYVDFYACFFRWDFSANECSSDFSKVWMIAHERFKGNLRLQVPGKVFRESGPNIEGHGNDNWIMHVEFCQTKQT